jgi:hypothetical protein
VDGYFSGANEETDLSGAGVLDVGHEVFAFAKVLLGCQVRFFTCCGARDCGGEAHGGNDDTARYRGDRRGGSRLPEKRSPAYRFHSSSLGGFLNYSEPPNGRMTKWEKLFLKMVLILEISFYLVFFEREQGRIRVPRIQLLP